MRRLKLATASFLLSLTTPILALAAPDTISKLENTGVKAGFNKNTDIFSVIALIINIALGTLGMVFLALIVYAGYMWLIAGGDEGKVETAKATITRAVIGLLIVLCAYGIANFVVPSIYCATHPEAASCGGDPFQPGGNG